MKINWDKLIRDTYTYSVVRDALSSLDSTLISDDTKIAMEVFGDDLVDYIAKSVEAGNTISSSYDNFIVYGDYKQVLTCDDDELFETAPIILEELGYDHENFNELIEEFMRRDCMDEKDILENYFDELNKDGIKEYKI